MGFVLFDGGYSGDWAFYQRKGIEHRWDWGDDGPTYAFVIKADGTGLYYDFSNVPEGEETTAKQVCKCYQR